MNGTDEFFAEYGFTRCAERLPDGDGVTEFCSEPATRIIEWVGDWEGRCEMCFQAAREWGGYTEAPATLVATAHGQ